MDARRLLALLLATLAAACSADEGAIRLPAWVEPAPAIALAAGQTDAPAPAPPRAQSGGPLDIGDLLGGPMLAPPRAESADEASDQHVPAELPTAQREPRPLRAPEPAPISSVHATRQLEHAASSATTSHALSRLITRYHETRERLIDAGQDPLVERADSVATWAYYARGRMKAAAGKHEAATADFRAALTVDRTNEAARQDLAITLAEEGRLDEALAELDAALEASPESITARRNRATVLLRMRRPDEALADCDAVLAAVGPESPGRADALRLRGVALHAAGRLREAAADLNESIRRDPHDAEAYVARGHVFAEGGFFRQAITDYRAALSVDAMCVSAYRSLAWVLSTCPDENLRGPKTAVEAAYRARRLVGSEDYLVLDASAAAHASAGDFEEAAAFQRRALKAAGDPPPADAVARLHRYERRTAFVAPPVR
ncbi:tetratricopeptide repeat protein [Botrimarina sp.]|uniref:tetratricopeptide repeat protein n=1 Tax=Botrimarina sp. TaxID=2795802 RepID=UPI0032EDF59B